MILVCDCKAKLDNSFYFYRSEDHKDHGWFVKPFIDEFGLFGGGSCESFLDNIHADGISFAPCGFLVRVNP